MSNENYYKFTSEEALDLWEDFIDRSRRERTTFPFFRDVLRNTGCQKVFDACSGSGLDTALLIKAGFDVTANEVEPSFQEWTQQTLSEEGLSAEMTTHDWRSIPAELTWKFDAVLCIGNSLTYLFDKSDQEKTVKNFARIVRPGGVVIIDHRNYDYMIGQRNHILKNPGNNFRYSNRFYYGGKNVIGYPVRIKEGLVTMEYLDKTNPKNVATLDLFPLKRSEVRSEMESSGLDVQTFGDFKPYDNGDHIDFYQHVGIKKTK